MEKVKRVKIRFETQSKTISKIELLYFIFITAYQETTNFYRTLMITNFEKENV